MKPSMTGIWQSMSTTSNSCFSSASSASTPLPACIGVAAQTLQHFERQRAVDHVVFDEQDREVIEHGFVLRCEHGGGGADFVEGHGLQRFVQGTAQHALAHGLGEAAHRRELRREGGLEIVGHRAHHDRGNRLPGRIAAYA